VPGLPSPVTATTSGRADNRDPKTQPARHYVVVPDAPRYGTRFVAHGHSVALIPDAPPRTQRERLPQGAPAPSNGNATDTAVRFAFAAVNPSPILAAEATLLGEANDGIGNDPSR